VIQIEPDEASFRRVARALADEGDGKELRAELVRNLKAVVEPAAEEARANILGMRSGGIPHAGESLRSAVAAGITTYVSLGKNPAVGIKASKRNLPRGFVNAPKRLNSRKGWKHRVFGRDVWVTQLGAPEWFDRPIERRRKQYERAVEKALEDVAHRISRKA
jgi:hypothetical protein